MAIQSSLLANQSFATRLLVLELLLLVAMMVAEVLVAMMVAGVLVAMMVADKQQMRESYSYFLL